jgi:cold-inducible RNA-binding protein
MDTKLYVGNLPYSTTEDEMREAFEAFGQVVSSSIIIDRETGRSRGFGFVEMGSSEEATAALNGMNGTQFGGRTLKVALARPRNDSRQQDNAARSEW